MKIGLLLPESSFYPYLGMDFLEGFKQALSPNIEIVEETIAITSPQEIQKAARKLITKDGVDLLTGWISYKSITALLPLIKQTRTPLIMCNAGEAPLIQADKNPYIIHCSLNLFDSTYLASKWAINTFGPRYSNILSFYDSGYPFSYALSLASAKYKGNTNLLEITGNDQGKSLETQRDNILNTKDAFIFSAFSGWDAIEFMDSLADCNEQPDIPIVSTSMCTDNAILNQSGIENIYSVNTWMNHKNDKWKKLDNHFTNELHRDISPFGILGNEAGIIASFCIENKWKPKMNLEDILINKEIDTTRGLIQLNPELNNFPCEHALFKTECLGKENNLQNSFIENLSLKLEDENIIKSEAKELSGWLNTYLCV